MSADSEDSGCFWYIALALLLLTGFAYVIEQGNKRASQLQSKPAPTAALPDVREGAPIDTPRKVLKPIPFTPTPLPDTPKPVTTSTPNPAYVYPHGPQVPWTAIRP